MSLQCQECNMEVETGEYHPYAACLMYKECYSKDIVLKNLEAVKNSGNETLKTEKYALAQALQELVLLKEMKDLTSDSPEYKKRKPLAWEAAKQVLDTLEI